MYVISADTSRMLRLVMKGFDSVKDVSTTPVRTMSVGNVSYGLVMRFWCSAEMMTGLSTIARL